MAQPGIPNPEPRGKTNICDANSIRQALVLGLTGTWYYEYVPEMAWCFLAVGYG